MDLVGVCLSQLHRRIESMPRQNTVGSPRMDLNARMSVFRNAFNEALDSLFQALGHPPGPVV